MSRSRRDLLAASAALATAGLAGCGGRTSGEETGDGSTDEAGTDATATGDSGSSSTRSDATATVEDAVAAEWNAMRARVHDALALGVAGESGAGAAVARGTFARFEGASGEYGAHETLESTSEANYGAFEEALGELRTEGLAAGDVARAAQYGAFALADAVEELPLRLRLAGASAGGGDGSGEGGESSLQGGPNVVEGVPDDADHVVEQLAVAYDPEQLTVSVGDTVAWPHAAGEAHTVFAYGDGIPEEADYWASGGFDSEAAAREGWEDGQGAVRSGESYVHTFETPGTHEYFCAPHEAAGMVGSVVVEE
jgi:plastocyanin